MCFITPLFLRFGSIESDMPKFQGRAAKSHRKTNLLVSVKDAGDEEPGLERDTVALG
jgi:hypothetical protein